MNFKTDLAQANGPKNAAVGIVRLKAYSKVSETKNGIKQGLLLADSAGNESWFSWFPNEGETLLTFKDKGKEMSFDIWQHNSFWNCCPSVSAQTAPPMASQSPQNAPQSSNYQQPAQPSNVSQHQQGEPQRNMTYAYESAPHVQASIQRSVALEAASRWSIGKPDCKAFDILNVAITFYDWLSTGNVPMSAAPEPELDEPAF